MGYIFETALVALIVYFFIAWFPATRICKSPGLIVASLLIGLLNAALSFLTELPLTFTGYFLLSVFFRLAIVLAVIKFIEDFYSWITAYSFRSLVVISIIVSIFSTLIPFLLGT